MLSYPRWQHKYQVKPGVWIFEPTEDSIRIGAEIKKAVEEKWIIPYNYFHLNQGGHIAALNLHKRDSLFVHLDIAKFFNTINKSRITRSLKKIFDYQTSRKYAIYSTVKNPSIPKNYFLPYGFIQSPIIASLCFFHSALGRKLNNLSKSKFARVSIYMDDIILSGDNYEILKRCMEEVKISAYKSGFALNSAKEEGPSAEIKVFNIKLTTGNTIIIDEKYDELRYSYNSTSNRNVKRGIATYVSTVNSDQLSSLDILAP